MSGKLARSTLQTSVWLGMRVLTQAVVLVLLTRLLGARVYGSFAAVASLAAVLSMLPNLGAGFVMLSRSARDDAGVAEIWRYAWPMATLLGVLLLAIYVMAAGLITTPSLPKPILLALGAAELLLTPLIVLMSFALQACERVPLSQCVQWLPLCLRALAVLPCFWLAEPQRLSFYAPLQLLASLLGAAIALCLTTRHVTLDWRPRLPTRRELRDGASYAAMNLVAANPSELDKIVAVRLVGSNNAGIYAAGSRIMSAMIMPVVAMLLASLPRLFRHAYEPSRGGRRLIGLLALIALGWGVVSGLILVLCAPLLPWIFGPSFTTMAELMPWLAAIAPFLSLRMTAGAVVVAFGRPLGRIAFELCGVLVMIGGMLALAPHFGARGLAMALLLGEGSMMMLGWWLVCRCMK